MVQALLSLFVKQNMDTPQNRKSIAMLCSVVSIILNTILFIGKIIGGAISGSVAITADAFNNLADAGTCLAELFGFQIAGIGAGRKHPFGHGRIEWLMGLFAAIAVLFVGYEMIKSSITAIVSPQSVQFTIPIFFVLTVSIAVKLYMFLYNRKFGIKINSIALQAKAYDCMGDMAATAAVLISSMITHLTGLQLDGWCGLVVSIFILYAGFQALNETVNPLIGNAPNKELTEQIEQIALEYPGVVEVYDVMVHDYGFHKLIASCHIGGSIESDTSDLIRVANDISQRLFRELNCETAVQVDLINTEQLINTQLMAQISNAVHKLNSEIKVSKVRIIQNLSSHCICVELVMPIKLAKRETEIRHLLETSMNQFDGQYRLMMKTKVYTVENKHKKLF